MAGERESTSKATDTAPAGEKKIESGGLMAVSIAADVLSVADHASGMLVGGAAGLVTGVVRGLGEGFDIGRAKGGLLGGVVGLPLAVVSQGLHGLATGMSKGFERGVSDIAGALKAP